MAMTKIVGHDGDITIATHKVAIRTFGVSLPMVVSEVTAYAAGGSAVNFREYRGGIFSGRLQFGGVPNFDASSSSPNAFNSARRTGVAVTATIATGCTYAGNVLLETLDFSGDKTGDMTVTGEGPFTGTITETWDETA